LSELVILYIEELDFFRRYCHHYGGLCQQMQYYHNLKIEIEGDYHFKTKGIDLH
jgi:hypothetical protein